MGGKSRTAGFPETAGELRRITEDWVNSPEGQQELDRAAEDIVQVVDKVTRDVHVPPEALRVPVTSPPIGLEGLTFEHPPLRKDQEAYLKKRVRRKPNRNLLFRARTA